MSDYIYDIETYPNVFTVYLGGVESRKSTSIEMSDRKDERKKLFRILNNLRREGDRMVGFNNIHFDYPVIHYLLNHKKATALELYNFAMKIIESEDRFEHTVWEGKHYVTQVDLFKIHHFDNIARATSLKMLEFNLRSDNIEDLPFPVGKILTDDEIDTLLIYNKHDVVQTLKFYRASKDYLDFREKLTKQYKRNFMNHNDTKIGKDYFIMRLEEEMPGSCYKGRKLQQTRRDSINIGDCIFDYVSFERPEFQAVLEWLKKQEIRETKGVFTDILESDLGDVAKHAVMRTKRQKFFRPPSSTVMAKYRSEKPLCWFTEEKLKSGKTSYWVNWNVVDTLNTVVDGFKYDFGTGGIHGSLESTILRSDDEYVIHDEDVASYYPNLAIKNKLYPEHLSSKFCDIYEDVYNQRKSYKKGTTENAMLKLALNGVYGDSNSQYSPFYDSKYTMSITINGQLLLCMLAERLSKISSLTMIQINTDGLTYHLHRDDYDIAKRVCKEWEELTQLELEGVDYESMFIRDVNNYISKSSYGLKNKGAYQWKELEHNKNHSSLIIPMAVERYLIHGEDIATTITNHTDIFDFMMRTKVPRKSRLVLETDSGDKPLQNICRYYASLEGGNLVKIMPPVKEFKTARVYEGEIDPPQLFYGYTKGEITKFDKKYTYLYDEEVKQGVRRIGVTTNQLVTCCNDINDFAGGIDYEYYIREAKKLIELKEYNET